MCTWPIWPVPMTPMRTISWCGSMGGAIIDDARRGGKGFGSVAERPLVADELLPRARRRAHLDRDERLAARPAANAHRPEAPALRRERPHEFQPRLRRARVVGGELVEARQHASELVERADVQARLPAQTL